MGIKAIWKSFGFLQKRLQKYISTQNKKIQKSRIELAKKEYDLEMANKLKKNIDSLLA